MGPDIRVDLLSSLKCAHVAGAVCKVGSFCRTKYMRQCPCRERGRQSFFFFFRLCERNCRNFCSPWLQFKCTDILWLLDPMTFTDSQHMTSLNKIFISFHTQVPVKTIRQGARRLVTHGLALMCLKYNLLSRGQEVFQIICINVSEKSEFLHLNFKIMFKCV